MHKYEFERVINSFRATWDVSIFITGSNGKLLSGELAILLSGGYQAAYYLADRSVIDREFGAFALIAGNYPKYVISMDRYDFSREGVFIRMR